MIEVLRPGPLATVQDLGRPGHAALGVGMSGAADRRALRLANRLVGNPEDAAAIEITLGGFAARFDAFARVALAGAPCDARVTPVGAVHTGAGPAPTGHAVGMHEALYLRAGSELRLAVPDAGLRTYLAVAGGIDVPPVLGSRSTDTLAGLGPARLRIGDRLPVGRVRGTPPGVDAVPVAAPRADAILRVLPGPRADWFPADALAAIVRERWEVTADADRVGIRLDGPALERCQDHAARELPPEGMVEGALQVPPDGRPVLFLADHPVTGGYPVIAIVVEADIPDAAQLRPGATVRFRRA
jgi:biotin-dependent carboxylase-like uncharacterized protein